MALNELKDLPAKFPAEMPLLFPSLELQQQCLCAELGADQGWHSSCAQEQQPLVFPVLLPCHCPAALLPLVLLQGLSALGLAHSPGLAVPGLQQGQAMGTAGAALPPQGRAWGLEAPCPGSLKSTPRPVLSRENPREQPQGGRGQGGGKQHGWCSARSLGEPGRSSRAGADPSPLRWTPQGSVPERPHAPASSIPPLQPWPLPSSERGWVLAGRDTAGLAQEPLFALHSPGVSTPTVLVWGDEPE